MSRLVLVRESALRRIFPGYRVCDPSTWHEGRVCQMWIPDDAIKIVRDPNTTVMFNHLQDDEWVERMSEISPEGVAAALRAMTEEQRAKAMELVDWCSHCYRLDPRCQCWNDE